MKFTALHPALLDALTSAAAVADARSTMPLLAHVLLRVSDRKVTIAATDLNLATVDTIAATGTKGGSLTLPAKPLRDLVAGLKGDVTIRLVEGKWAEIKAGRTTMRLAGLSAADYPNLPQAPDDFTAVSAPEIVRVLSTCVPSICHDETRFNLATVQLVREGKGLRAASTDGHRLTLATAEMASPSAAEMLIPRLGVARLIAMAKGLATLELAHAGPYLFARSNDHLLAVKLVDAQYPPIEQVIPKHKASLTVDRAALLDAVKRCALMASESRGLSISIGDGELSLRTSDPDRGDVREELDAECKSGPTVSVNPKYLIDALGAMACDQVAIAYGGELEPLLVSGGAATFVVVMPMRI